MNQKPRIQNLCKEYPKQGVGRPSGGQIVKMCYQTEWASLQIELYSSPIIYEMIGYQRLTTRKRSSILNILG